MKSFSSPQGAAGLFAWLITALLPTIGVADDTSPTAGALTIFPGSGLRPLSETTEQNISTPVGWNIPGRSYRAGGGWWVMDCTTSCRLDPARLIVRDGSHPDYDGPPLPSQLLTWRLNSGPNAGQNGTLPLLLFRPNTGQKIAFSAGRVPTWLHAGMGSYPEGERPGRMETEIDLGPDGKAYVLPRIIQPRNEDPPKNTYRGHAEDHETSLVFELRAYGRRQRLGSYTWDILGARPLAGPEYLLWAGDLDGDGKLDVLMSYASRGWSTVLYLSSFAGPGEIVGEAGRFVFWPPDDPGC